eukprot:TRINITY_DN38210_c0_g1_i1.p1 TRINITY_DN38210_c0_g1~~TRINITY_DN38210_c0_g1_i1.p1  ORF type:complete len:833 (-),score=86.94 TRINITY_DN38210_c0_g1_i1:538-3036(-)
MSLPNFESLFARQAALLEEIGDAHRSVVASLRQEISSLQRRIHSVSTVDEALDGGSDDGSCIDPLACAKVCSNAVTSDGVDKQKEVGVTNVSILPSQKSLCECDTTTDVNVLAQAEHEPSHPRAPEAPLFQIAEREKVKEYSHETSSMLPGVAVLSENIGDCHALKPSSERSEMLSSRRASCARRTSVVPSGRVKITFEPWPDWCDVLQSPTPVANRGRETQSRHTRIQTSPFPGQHTSCVLRRLQGLVIRPDCLGFCIWVNIGLAAITYDVVMLPLSAFSLPLGKSLEIAVPFLFGVYWALDLFTSFFVAYYERGEPELNVKKTAKRYCTSWLPFDSIFLTVDWIILISNVTGGLGDYATVSRSMRAVRMWRSLRVLRLFRLMKMPHLVGQTHPLFRHLCGRSEHIALCLGILRHLCCILLINHVIACAWYSIGREDGWVDKFQTQGGWTNKEQPWALLYATSLHWSLTQFTPASMSVQPTNMGERAFAVSVLLFALVAFSSFVSSITNLMNHLRTIRSTEDKQLRMLERYLEDNKISFQLSLRVRRFLEHYFSQKRKACNERDIEVLAQLSGPLRMELHFEVYSPHLVKHPFFCFYSRVSLPGMQKLSHTALTSIDMASDDVLFNDGEIAKAMYFCSRGRLEYVQTGKELKNVSVGQWVSEMVLWTPWEHKGQACSGIETCLLALDAAKFRAAVVQHKSGVLETGEYAVRIVDMLTAASGDDMLSDLTVGDPEALDFIGQDVPAQRLATQAFNTHRTSVTSQDSGGPSVGFRLKRTLTSAIGAVGGAARPRRGLSVHSLVVPSSPTDKDYRVSQTSSRSDSNSTDSACCG